MKRWEPDTLLPGLGILTFKSGKRAWYLRYREQSHRGGRQRTRKIGDARNINRTLARVEAKRILGDIANGVQKFEGRATVAELRDLMEHRHYPKLRQSSVKAYRCYWNNDVLPVMGHRPVVGITRAEITNLLADTKGTKGNRILQMLKSAFNQAEIWGLRPDNSNPCKRIKKQPERMRRRYLARPEVNKLLDACDEFGLNEMRWRFTQMIKLLLFTGARRGEIMAARWDWLDTRNAVLIIPADHHKTGSDGHERTIHLNNPAMEVLSQLRKRSTSDWIIQGRGNGPLIGAAKMWRQLLDVAGIKDLHIHDLRHTFAAMGVTAGLSMVQIGGLLGHASPVTTSRYAHLIDETAAASAAKVAAQIKKPG